MKSKITISIALVLSIILVSLVVFDTATNAQPRRQRIFDTGAVTLGPNQYLRITVNGGDGNDSLGLRFRQMRYAPLMCDGSVRTCKYTVASENTTAPIRLRGNEAVSFDIMPAPESPVVRGVALGDVNGDGIDDIRVNAEVINSQTGHVDGIIAILIG